MAVRLDINVRGVKGLGGRGGSSPAAMQRQVAKLTKIQERSELKLQKLREQLRRSNEIAALAFNRKEERAHAAAIRRQQARKLKSQRLYQRGVDQWRQRAQRQRAAEERRYARLRIQQERTVQRRKLRNIARLKRAMRGLVRGAGRGAGSIAGGIGGAGAGIGGALTAITSGGGGLGGLVRGAGGAASSLVGGAGSLAGGVAGAIPGVGGIAKSIVGGITSAASGVVSAAANLGGMFVDKFVGILKVGLVAGVGIAFVSIRKAMQFEGLEESFKGLIRTWGEDAPTALAAFRVAAKGTVSDIDLLQSANNALLLGTVDTVPEFGKLIDAGRRLGTAMGRSAAEGLQDLAVGLGRQSRLVLDNLGIIVRTEAAYQTWAETMGTTVSAMSAAQKTEAFKEEFWRGLAERMGQLGDETETLGGIWDQFKSEIENTAVAIGQIFLPVLKELLPEITRILTGFKEWLSANNINLAKKLSDVMSGIVGWLKNIADFIEGNGFGAFFENAKRWAADFFTYVQGMVQALVTDISGHIKHLMDQSKGGTQEFLLELGGGFLDQITGGLQLIPGVKDLIESTTGHRSFREAGASVGETRQENRDRQLAITQGVARAQRRSTQRNWAAAPPLLPGVGGGGGGGGGGIVGEGRDPSGRLQLLGGGGAGGAVPVQIVGPGAPTAPTTTTTTTTTAAVQTARFPAAPGAPVHARMGEGPDPAEVAAIAARMRSVISSLKSIGVTYEELPKELQAMLEQASKSEEATTELREAAEKKAASIHKQAIVDASKATVEALEAQRDGSTKIKDEAQKTWDEMAANLKTLGESLKTKLAEIDAALEQDFDTIHQQGLQAASQVFSQMESRAQGLLGAAGGIEAQGGIPLNVRRAASKVRRRRTRQRKDELRRATAGMSSDDLAANDGALLQQVLHDQAARETGARGQLAAILQETQTMYADAEAASLEEQEAVRTAAEDAHDSITAAMDKEAETLKATAEALKKIDDRMKKAESALESVKKAVALVGS